MKEERAQNILFYQSDDASIYVEVYFHHETFWLTQKAMAELFDCTTDNISLHLKNIFFDEELVKEAVTEKLSVTASDGKKYLTQFSEFDRETEKYLKGGTSQP